MAKLSDSLVKSREDLAAEKAKSDALFASIGEAVIATDEHGKIMKVNNAALELLESDKDDLLNKRYFDAIRARDHDGNAIEPLSRPVMQALQEGKSVTDTLEYARKDGSYFPAVITTSPVMLDGRPIGTIEVFRDVTQEQQIDRAKTEFVSLASHQLRTPLTSMRLYTELLLTGHDGELTSAQQERLRKIRGTSIRMTELVNALLSVARIEVGKLTFVLERNDIAAIASDVVYDLRPQIAEKLLHFHESFDPSLSLLPLDQNWTRVIFQNLLANAIKYTPRGGEIRLAIERMRQYILITVSDTGYGIPKSQWNQIFTKLFRADNVRDKETSGTGLGLYIVKSIVAYCQGEIWFDSKENEGTSFYVRLPLGGMSAAARTAHDAA